MGEFIVSNNINENPGCLGFILQSFGLLPKQVCKAVPKESLPYAIRDDFLSKAEFSFYKVLDQVIGEKAIICPKVSLKDIFFVKSRNKSDFSKYNNKINLKHVDFLICSKETMKPICGVELDDSSHARQDRIERDNFVNKVFEFANLKLIRFQNKSSYTIVEIGEKINSVFMTEEIKTDENKKIEVQSNDKEIPICKKCGIPMILRVVKKGENVGQKFYGCPNYPKCREIVKID